MAALADHRGADGVDGEAVRLRYRSMARMVGVGPNRLGRLISTLVGITGCCRHGPKCRLTRRNARFKRVPAIDGAGHIRYRSRNPAFAVLTCHRGPAV